MKLINLLYQQLTSIKMDTTPQSETVPKRIFQIFMCLWQKNPSALSYATFSVRLCCLHAFLYLLRSYLSLYIHPMYHLTLQIPILAIAPGKPKMCLQENLVNCADCGGLVD